MVDISHFKSRLTKRRGEFAKMIATYEQRLDDPKPNDSEDRATASEGDEVMEAQVEAEYAEIKAIDAALSRIDNDVYGICLSCEGPISDERLEAVLHATLCRRCMETA
ncbi:MAG: TraR/DksA family transcriptional regulator [Rhizobiaceae bacterium]|nr:TraR/DksA family transcriptional regulator [Rhizobiaceae bacterium]